MTAPAPRDPAQANAAWPFQEAERVLARLGAKPPAKGYVLFATGYGPSGLPHIGTFGEVARTTMVRHALATLSDLPTRLWAFSDDMDGLRKIPDNLPNPELIRPHLGKPLTSIPDPFGTHESFGHHMNARLRAFLDTFGFAYEFESSSANYRAGKYDAALRDVLHHYDTVMAIILPTLGLERRATYSPFLPLCPKTGRVLQVSIVARDEAAGTVSYRDEDGKLIEVPVTGGHCKLQWKADWAMRWHACQVDYEMSGKDLIPSVELSSKICRALGSEPPLNFTYELFLDENGEKISKSRGNGLTINDWLRYGPKESLALFMFNQPKRAKRLYFDVIPRQVDDYLSHLARYQEEDETRRRANPVWHIHAGKPPKPESGLSYTILLNLAAVCNTEDKAVLWGFISRYVPSASPTGTPFLDALVGHAIHYYRDFVKPKKRYRAPTETERSALVALLAALQELPEQASAEIIQTVVYEIGKGFPFASLRDWFKALYEILLGQSDGPRMGSFIALYGKAESITLIQDALGGKLAA
jgi:lysyl-tRNA synthetase class 1